jgi:hypothetical protein
MAYIIYSPQRGPIAYIDDSILNAHPGDGEIAIPCEPGADVNDAERWRQEAEYMTGNGAIAPTLELAKEVKTEEIAAARWKAETSGVEYLGVKMHTDRDSQAKYTGAVVAYQATGAYPTNWKGVNGWLEIPDAATLMGLATAVVQHVDTCFVNEKILADQVTAAETIEDVQAITWETI